MLDITKEPLFGFLLCVFAYLLGVWVNKTVKSTLANPLLIAAAAIIAILKIFKIPLENFMVGANFVSMFLAPATAALAVNIYRQLETIKQNLIPILVGCVVGAGSAIGSILLMCRLLNLSDSITASLVPKSITTAIAIKLSEQLGGLSAVTMAAVFVTGLLGAVAAPLFIRLFRVDDPVASGLAIGASSHALGTTKAIEIGELEGTLSGIAVGLCGLVTVLICVFL